MIKRLVLFAGLLSTVVLLVIACQPVTDNRPTESGATATMPAELKSGFDTITTADLMQHRHYRSADPSGAEAFTRSYVDAFHQPSPDSIMRNRRSL